MKVIKFAPGLVPVLKHGNHDQSTHGSWAESGSSKLTIMGKNDGTNEFFNEKTRVVRFQPEGKEPVDYVLYASDSFSSSFVVALVKPTDGTTINGYSESSTNRGEVGHLDVTSSQNNAWRRNSNDGKATIVEVAVQKAHQRRGLASAMLKFHRDRYPELDVQHSDAQLPDGKAWAEVAKHGNHDQSSHGNWADGNGLGIEEVMRLHKTSDPLKNNIYDAEASLDKLKDSREGKPTVLPRRANFESAEDYDKAYKEYSKKWMDWAVEQQATILSDTGKKLLDGTPAGVKKYVEKIIKEDWFLEKFGDGSAMPKLGVKTSNTNAAGRHILKVQKDAYTGRIIKAVHEISIDRQSVKNERVILHEISHYATAISQTESYHPHGVEFAKNHIYVTEQTAGPARAEALAKAYKGKGVEIGN